MTKPFFWKARATNSYSANNRIINWKEPPTCLWWNRIPQRDAKVLWQQIQSSGYYDNKFNPVVKSFNSDVFVFHLHKWSYVFVKCVSHAKYVTSLYFTEDNLSVQLTHGTVSCSGHPINGSRFMLLEPVRYRFTYPGRKLYKVDFAIETEPSRAHDLIQYGRAKMQGRTFSGGSFHLVNHLSLL